MFTYMGVLHNPTTDFHACLAQFEHATYALEEFVAAGKSSYFNGIQRKNGTVY
jgi:hypothetical protein